MFEGRWKEVVTGQTVWQKQLRQRLVNQSIGSKLYSYYVDYTG